jgi:hypothetical protein
LSRVGSEVIAYSPARLSAVFIRGNDGDSISVYRSVRVREDDALFAPVRLVLDSNCTEELSSETVIDREMMFGRAVRSVVRVWAVCPAEPHDCARLPIPAARMGMEVITLDRTAVG